MNWAEYAKLAPIVAYPGWESAVKENRFLLEKLTELRLKGAKVCFERKKRALEFEAPLYLHTASLAIPFSEEWFRITCSSASDKNYCRELATKLGSTE